MVLALGIAFFLTLAFVTDLVTKLGKHRPLN